MCEEQFLGSLHPNIAQLINIWFPCFARLLLAPHHHARYFLRVQLYQNLVRYFYSKCWLRCSHFLKDRCFESRGYYVREEHGNTSVSGSSGELLVCASLPKVDRARSLLNPFFLCSSMIYSKNIAARWMTQNNSARFSKSWLKFQLKLYPIYRDSNLAATSII